MSRSKSENDKLFGGVKLGQVSRLQASRQHVSKRKETYGNSCLTVMAVWYLTLSHVYFV
jgi:hypothetical protein